MGIEIEIEIEIPRTGIIPVDVTSLFYLSLRLCVLSIILWDLLHAMNHESRITPTFTFMSISISHTTVRHVPPPPLIGTISYIYPCSAFCVHLPYREGTMHIQTASHTGWTGLEYLTDGHINIM